MKALKVLEGDNNVFITGAAGSGKSFVIKEYMKSRNEKVFPILASTGSAAVLVGGRTFHSFFGLGIMEGGLERTVNRALDNKRVVRRIKKIEGFVLDEVSMLASEVLRAAEIIARRARETHSPWGGLKVIAVGDFAQLPPVQRGGEKRWAFLDPLWQDTNFESVYLKENVRSQNQDFLEILAKVRKGQCDQSVVEFLEQKTVGFSEELSGTRLFPRRDQTHKFNLLRLNEIDSPVVEIFSEYSGSEMHVKQLKRNAPIPEVLSLKQGAFVMLRQNDPRGRWVNGSTGSIEDLSEDSLVIQLDSGQFVNLEKSTFTLLDSEGKEVAVVKNFPVSLAYAATIHKAQGMTLDKMVVDLKSLWEPGHAYVALSRVRDPENIYIQDWSQGSIKTDPKVTAFYQSFKN